MVRSIFEAPKPGRRPSSGDLFPKVRTCLILELKDVHDYSR